MTRKVYQERAAEFFTVAQAAEALQVSVCKVYKLIHQNVLAHERIDGILHIPPSAVRAYQQEQQRLARETLGAARSPEWRIARARLGGLTRAMQYSHAEMSDQVRAGKERAAAQAIDPDSRLRNRNPAEYYRRVQAHQARNLAKARLAKATNDQRRRARHEEQHLSRQ